MDNSRAPGNVDCAIVLAGGLGTRLREAVPDLPKPMAPINGRPFLEHQLDYWIDQGIKRFVLSVGYRRDAITSHFGASYRDATIEYAIEESPLGTGGGLLLAAAFVDRKRPCLVVNGDTFFEVSLVELESFHHRKGSDWTIAMFRTAESGRYMGLQVAHDGRIESMRSGLPGEAEVLSNGGVYLIGADILADCGFAVGTPASLENDILAALRDRGAKIFGYECAGRFIDIGIPHDYFRAGELLDGRNQP